MRPPTIVVLLGVLLWVFGTLACSPKPDAARAAASAREEVIGGASTTPPPTTAAVLSTPMWDEDLETSVVPPIGWRSDSPKVTGQHIHKTWLSANGRTAYGVIRFKLPMPVSEDLALWGFLREMRRTEGEATLLEKFFDASLPGLRFVAEGGKYKVRTNLTVRGFHGWCVYAGTVRSEPVMSTELQTAIAAREATRPGRPNVSAIPPSAGPQ